MYLAHHIPKNILITILIKDTILMILLNYHCTLLNKI